MEELILEKKHSKVIEHEEIEEFFNTRDIPVTEETACGIGPLRGVFLQRFANKKMYVFLYGCLGCFFGSTFAYFNAIITTLEKRFKIPSKVTGIITVGNDISQLFVSLALAYYCGKGHRPRWIAVGIYTVVIFCFLIMLPHIIYGPGEDALSLTVEYGASLDQSSTPDVLARYMKRSLCRVENETVGTTCSDGEGGSIAPQVLLFAAQLIAGIGGSVYYTLGVSYMDDNIKKTKMPALVSLSYFLRMLGPAIGYGLASFCLKIYVAPSLNPTITATDPRWIGAWWMGWIILALILFLFASLIGLFPKSLPRAAHRKMLTAARSIEPPEVEEKASFKDMFVTFKRLITNKILMCNNLAAIFYIFGYMPFWIFMPKYIETQYKQSASMASLVTGSVGLVFMAIGVLVSGAVISRFKPRARILAGWNVFLGLVTFLGIVCYAFLGCSEGDNQGKLLPSGELAVDFECNAACKCDYVKYSPVCGADGVTYISPCHAGCTSQETDGKNKVYTQCSCIHVPNLNVSATSFPLTSDSLLGLANVTHREEEPDFLFQEGTAVPGPCPVDCTSKFIAFLVVACIIKLFGATGLASNFLVGVRCIDEKDKPVSMGLTLTLFSLFSFMPSPIMFGVILDKTCLVWGKSCTGTGNCWLYNGAALRYTLNFTSAAFIAMGTFFDAGVWYYVKDLKIFDEEVNEDGSDKKNEGGTVKENVNNSK